MVYSLFQRIINVAIVLLVVLILAIAVNFLWSHIVVGLLNGPPITYFEIALLMAIISVGAVDIVVLPRRSPATT